MSRSCVVVGAGIAGLTAAHRLANAGVRVTVIEGEDHIGGRARTEHVGAFAINTGAGMLTSFYDSTLALLRELRLEVRAPRKQPAIVATPFGKMPLDQGSTFTLLSFPLVPWWTKARALWLSARLQAGRRIHIADLPSMARADGRYTTERWACRGAGRATYEYLLRPAIESTFFFGAEEASMALGKALVRHSRRWQVLALRSGMGTLCDLLAQRLDVRTGCRAGGLEISARGVAIHHSGGTVEADYAILACPAPITARFEGPLPRDDREDIAAIRYAPNIALFFGYERPVTVQHPWVTPAGPGRHPIATIWTTSGRLDGCLPEGKELIVIHASAWRSAELLDRDRNEIVSALRTDAEEIFGRLADPDWIRLYPRAHATVIPAPGHYRRMDALINRSRERLYYAGDWLTGSSIEGAVRTGFNAAERILARTS